jgi:hypothetical protein
VYTVRIEEKTQVIDSRTLVIRYTAALLCMSAILVAQQKDSAYLKTKVNPGRAGVFVDGKYLGPAANFKIARKYAVSPGQHEVKFVDPRYEDVTTTVTLAAGKTLVVAQTLKPLPPAKPPFGRIRTECPDKYAAVYVNDRFYGHAGEFNNPVQGILLPPGEYTVRIEPLSGGNAVKKTVKVEADKTVVVM